MSAVQAAFLFAGLLLVAAGWIAVTTRRATRRAVVWLVPPDAHLAHAFRPADLKNFHEVSPLGHCGTWPVAELREDEHVTRCAPCERAARTLE
jgi:hypothetical protein